MEEEEEEAQWKESKAAVNATASSSSPRATSSRCFGFCSQCGVQATGNFCSECGSPTPERKKRAAVTPPSSPPPPLKKQQRSSHEKVRWTKEEVLFVQRWTEQNPPTADAGGRVVWQWARCALEGEGILQPAHARGPFVRACYRSLKKGAYTTMLTG